MARENFNDVIAHKVTSGGDTFLEPLGNVQITVYGVSEAGVRDSSAANIYTARLGGTAHDNPFVTAVDGKIDFWADFGDYDIVMHDLNATPRIADRTVGWLNYGWRGSAILGILSNVGSNTTDIATLGSSFTTLQTDHLALVDRVVALENIKPIRGRVNTDGSIAAGTGFSVAHTGTGHYEIHFPILAAIPAAVANVIAGTAELCAAVYDIANSSTTKATFKFESESSGGTAFDVAFSFVIIPV